MKYFEVRFRGEGWNESMRDVLWGVRGEMGFESLVECEKGMKG